jgi:hypothetical protein
MATLRLRSIAFLAACLVRRAAMAFFVSALALSGACAHAAERTPLERSVKAAFLYKFAGYVEWPQLAPQQQGAPLLIAIAGADDIASELELAVAGRTINERPIAVRRIAEGDSLAGVHILFIGTQERVRIAAWLRAAQIYPVLIVTEGEGALAMGSALNFVIQDGRVRFEASPEAAEKKGLKLSSRLLGVATNIRSGGQQ